MKKLNWVFALLALALLSCGDDKEKKENDPTDENSALKTAVLENC